VDEQQRQSSLETLPSDGPNHTGEFDLHRPQIPEAKILARGLRVHPEDRLTDSP